MGNGHAFVIVYRALIELGGRLISAKLFFLTVKFLRAILIS
jgi:hypothetical protein